ncbi:MAG TPA: hypothetical protein VF006_20340 [Longimicrobium sp.]
MTRNLHRQALVLIAVVALATTGCDVLGRISGAYRGPLPGTEALAGEIVTVRSISVEPGTRLLILDRDRFVAAGDPHDVNRVIKAITVDVQEQVQALNLRAGDRLVVSTRFIQIDETGDLRGVPNWPGHDFHEYPVGLHSLTAVARAD